MVSTESFQTVAVITDTSNINKDSRYFETIEMIDRLLLCEIFKFQSYYNNKIKAVIKAAEDGDINKLVQAATAIEHSDLKTRIQDAKKNLAQFGSYEVVRKILDNEAFSYTNYAGKVEYFSFGDKKTLLPQYSSFDSFKANDPKADLYKRMGATITS